MLLASDRLMAHHRAIVLPHSAKFRRWQEFAILTRFVSMALANDAPSFRQGVCCLAHVM